MNAPSPQSASSAPEFAGILRNRLESMAHKTVALDVKIDASLLGKFVGGTGALKLEDVSNLMRVTGLKAVNLNRICITPEELRFLRRLYARVTDQAPWLLQDDEVAE